MRDILKNIIQAFAFCLISLTCLIPSYTQAKSQNGIQFSKVPSNNQLYPRDLETNLGNIEFEGILDNSIVFDSLVLEHTDSQGNTESIILSNSPKRNFNHSIEIQAALVNHSFEIFSFSNGNRNSLFKALDVVAGDAYLIYGQSNALAQPSNTNHNNFLRTYGSSNTNAFKWFKSEETIENIAYQDIPIGTWGQKLGDEVIMAMQIPIAIINGAAGGMTIQQLLPENNDMAIPTKHYAHFAKRVKEAKLANAIRTLIWWQGESDGFAWACRSIEEYSVLFKEMEFAWEKDFGALEHTFLFQPQACGGFGITPQCMIQIQEAQRKLGQTSTKHTTLPTGHYQMSNDNCHFTLQGYLDAGHDISNMILNELYQLNREPPFARIESISFTNCTKRAISIQLSNSIEISIDSNHYQDIRIEGDSTLYISSIDFESNSIELLLNKPIVNSVTGISYLSHHFAGTPLFLVNSKSLPQFYNLKISYPDQDQDGYNCLNDCDDLDPNISPMAVDFSVNGVDEDCDGYDGPFDSLEDELHAKTLVTPNPTQSQLAIILNKSGNYEISILNSQGDIVQKKKHQRSGLKTYDLNELGKGVYVFRIHHLDLDVFISKRVIKN